MFEFENCIFLRLLQYFNNLSYLLHYFNFYIRKCVIFFIMKVKLLKLCFHMKFISFNFKLLCFNLKLNMDIIIY